MLFTAIYMMPYIISEVASPRTVCANGTASEGFNITAPGGQVLDAVLFASYGTPTGRCSNYSVGSCSANTSTTVSAIKGLCSGRRWCSIAAGSMNATFGDPCNGPSKWLVVEMSYKGQPSSMPTAQPTGVYVQVLGYVMLWHTHKSCLLYFDDV